MTYREVNGVSVVALDGRIVLGEESNALREKVKSLIAEGEKKIVLNMDNVTFIDGAGLGTLVAAHHSLKTQVASLRLCHLGSKVQEVLQLPHCMLVKESMQTGAHATPVETAYFRIEPDTAKRVAIIPAELLRILNEDRSFRRWFDELTFSMRKWICDWIVNVKNPQSRVRRAE